MADGLLIGENESERYEEPKSDNDGSVSCVARECYLGNEVSVACKAAQTVFPICM